MSEIVEARRTFRRLHDQGCFVIPNPWDVGTARCLERLGFKALATTSAGFAYSQGLTDGNVARDVMLSHIRAIVAATPLPVNADYESGHAVTLEELTESVRLCVETGVAGLSIEDSTLGPDEPLYPLDTAVARIRAARAAIDQTRADVLLTARSEGFIVGRPDLAETVARLKAYSAAGADCLYAPGIHTPEQIEAVVAAAAPKPVNFLAYPAAPMTLHELQALGVRRISVGSGLARAAWAGFLRVARDIADHGRFDGLKTAATSLELKELFL
jgi:2-methylisocitrate lyase-like PEP mutase family enzyme